MRQSKIEEAPRFPAELECLHGLDKVADRLSVSIWTIRKWCNEGRLESVMMGSRRLIRESEVQRTITQGLRET